MSNENENKEKTIKKITIRVTKDEAKEISRKAMECYLTQNEYIKSSALNKEIIVNEKINERLNGLKELTLEIKRIGTNINQISKHLNAGNKLTDNEKIYLFEGLEKIWQQLKYYTGKNP